ncbi:hypothetical protein R5W24_001122 [Gemmata sp. JC717]|uniref:hypothetical protein n=1 Tax=Gemmata algarum TaxID=2975278 RepID=UPI0021BACBE5|nr:hypothetical protein [Gemmata algarum]MDY3552042.1 hypothetical protein [Gemmata algarum]
MFHVYEEPAAPADRLAVLSDRDWELLTAPQRAAYRLRAGGFGTGLEAVVRMIELEDDSRAVPAEAGAESQEARRER